MSDEYIDEILSENRSLKDEVDQLGGGKAALHFEIERLRGLNDELYAEVERLTAQVTGRSGYVFTSTMQEMSDTMTRQALEIQRLRESTPVVSTCPVCEARKKAKTLAQKKWRGTPKEV